MEHFFDADRSVDQALIIRQGRLVAGLTFLDELPIPLRRALLMGPRVARSVSFEDAEVLADYARVERGTNRYNDFIDAAMKSDSTSVG
jgi:hypothetical protein